MNHNKKNTKIIDAIDLQNEKKVNDFLKNEGYYSKTHTFPIASLIFELTHHCNLSCRHCYNNSGNNGIEDMMTPQKWIDFARYIVECGGVFECVLSGGEPLLLGEKLFELMDIFHDDGTIFYLNTNGYLLSTKVVEKLSKYRYHKIQISIDGATPEYHDWFRQRPGSWHNAVEGAKLIAKNGLPLKIAHCVTPKNINEIDIMCELAHSLGASIIMVGELCYSGRASTNKELLLSLEQKDYLFKKVRENLLKYNGRMKVRCSHSVKEGLERHYKSPNSDATIRPNGDIRIDSMAPFVVGNVLRDDFKEIWCKKIHTAWNHPLVKEFVNSFDELDRSSLYTNYVEDDIYL